MSVRYKIYRLSAKTIISYAKEIKAGVYSFDLDNNATERCKIFTANHEQEDNALFFQIMQVLHEGDFKQPKGNAYIEDLSDIICFIDFAEIFDRDSNSARYALRQKKAESMFRPEGIKLDFGSGQKAYVAFERSASMSRQARLSFIRKDFYEPVRKRIMMNMKLGVCQLSKLYAYNGLMLSGGTRIECIDIDKAHRVIVVDNNEINARSKVITVEDTTGKGSVRKYERVEKNEYFHITEFDGEGLVSKKYAEIIDKAFCGTHCHTSFQIRLPYVKGMLHQVDFKDFFKNCATYVLKDIWGEKHKVDDVDIILTKSMFKGYGWLKENNMSWADYWRYFRLYDHALYITGVSKEHPEATTELNYQFLNTLSMKAEEFRPADLPLGWTVSPETDERHWITKQIETEYYNLCANEEYRKQYFLKVLKYRGIDKKSKRYLLAKILQKNPLFINESIYVHELKSRAEKVYKNYSVGTLIVSGDNRFLSADLFGFMQLLVNPDLTRFDSKQRKFFAIMCADTFQKNSFYSPETVYSHDKTCTLLRNPHIARNEEIRLYYYPKVEKLRKKYLGHLTDVIMVDSTMYAAERLGGADYDGDMIKTITDPILNACVERNYDFEDSIDNHNNIPFLKIPSAEAQLRDANDWYARFETVKSTFSSRVGQISNAALDRSIIAYNENSNAEERERLRKEVETLAILTALEIDSAKSGVKPDLSKYLNRGNRQKNIFLRYKYMTEKKGGRSEYYEDTPKKKLDKFIANTDWSKVDSNIERLPYYAYMLRKHTPKAPVNERPAHELFSFAAEPNWQRKLNRGLLSLMEGIIKEYEHCLKRIRISKSNIKIKPKKTDIDRILYARGQENLYDIDEMYADFSKIDAEQIEKLRATICEQSWHLMDSLERMSFLEDNLPWNLVNNYGELLCDFRSGGYRILGDLICDIDDANKDAERRILVRDDDTELWKSMIVSYHKRSVGDSYRDAVSQGCRQYLETIIKPSEAVKYAIALGKKKFVFDVLLDKVAENVLPYKEV